MGSSVCVGATQLGGSPIQRPLLVDGSEQRRIGRVERDPIGREPAIDCGVANMSIGVLVRTVSYGGYGNGGSNAL